MLSSIFLDKILASVESATSKYSTVSQCLGALQGWPGSVKFVLDGARKNQRTYPSRTTAAR